MQIFTVKDHPEWKKLESSLARKDAALGKAVEGLESCIYHTTENRDKEDQEWCPSCGEILSATNMRGELRVFSHQDDCKLEQSLTACREAMTKP